MYACSRNKFAMMGLLALGGFAGCTDRGSDPSDRQGVAVVSRSADSVSIVFLNQNNAARAPDIIAGSNPTGFQWIKLDLSAAKSDELEASGSTHIDLTSLSDGSSFSQEYSGPCNPALDNFNACWLFETYRAGDPGLTGYVDLQKSATAITGGMEVSWTGMTDRFGNPAQQHTHNTMITIASTVHDVQSGAGK